MELNAEQIKKALGCCANRQMSCNNCPYVHADTADDGSCAEKMEADALALITSQEQRIGAQDMTISELRQRAEKAEHDADRYAQRIKELTEENERLRGFNSAKCEDCAGCTSWKCDCANIEADTVRKMQERLIAEFRKDDRMNYYIRMTLDQIAKEMLEGANG